MWAVRPAVVPADLADMQRCFRESHRALEPPTVRLAMRSLVRDARVRLLAGCLVGAVGAVAAQSLAWPQVLLYMLGVALALAAAVLIALRRWSHRLWDSLITRVTTQLDMAPHNASTVYNSRGIACLVATRPGESRILASASVLSGDVANRIRSPTVPSLGPKDCLLTRVGVCPEAMGRGAGRALVEACIAWARREGFERMRLLTTTPQAPAIALYASLGFSEHLRRDVLPLVGYAELVLERTL